MLISFGMSRKSEPEFSKLRQMMLPSKSKSRRKESSPGSSHASRRNRGESQQEANLNPRRADVPLFRSPRGANAPVPPIATPQEEKPLFISIGIDLGTTFSGVAWSLSTSPNDIVIVSSWETEDIPRSTDLHKVPSVLTYNSSGEVTSWGYRLDEERNAISWFKLCLSEKASRTLAIEQPDRNQRLQLLLKNFNKEPVDIVADYLRCLWEHVKEDIEEKTNQWLWENIQLKIVLTVPATWDHKAQEMTRKAAEQAGLTERPGTTLELIGEPEAAALEVFTEMRIQRRGDLKVGDTFIVCDAGGGTVDLISYLIEELHPLRLSMCSESTGDLCGAIFVDGAFEQKIRTLLSDDDFRGMTRYSKRGMMRHWEYGPKRTFRLGGRKELWNIDIPGFQGVQLSTPEDIQAQSANGSSISEMTTAQKRLSNLRLTSAVLSVENLRPRMNSGVVALRTAHLTAIFSEVCSRIIALIGAQRAIIKARKGQEPAAILLVGGFGENVYLKQQLQQSFGNSGIKIQQPTKAWAAICRGAVLRGHGNDVVVNHISKYNYGCSYSPQFVEGVHLEQDRRWDNVLGYDLADRQIRWFLNRGENVLKDAPVTHEFFWPLTSARQMKYIEVFIYYSDNSVPEKRVENDVKPMCTIKVILDQSVFEELPTKINAQGKEWKKLDYVLELKLSSGQLYWSVKRDGIDIGNAKMEVTYE